MSRFFSEKYEGLSPYVPGEQPRGGRKFVKLNTNESPFPPSPKAVAAGIEAVNGLNLYSDPSCIELRRKASDVFGVGADNITCANGSDEVLNFAFAAFCDSGTPAVFPDVTYGFYPVFAAQNRVPFKEIPLKEDFSVDVERMAAEKGTLFIANPNAPTGVALSLEAIRFLLESDASRMVVVDEAYVDFGAESAVGLVGKYENLLVTQTFSKSRSMAGARLGFGFAQERVIADIETLRNSVNPYNVNSVTQAMGAGALEDEAYTRENCLVIEKNRDELSAYLKRRGFLLTDSKANFVFAAHPKIGGVGFYLKLREKGILVRHFARPERIVDYNRITVGSREQTDVFEKAVDGILEEIL
jgi:histidinol-phosphate aminotransferase